MPLVSLLKCYFLFSENPTDIVPDTIENISNQDVEKLKKKLAATRSKLYRKNTHLKGKRRDISPKDRKAIMLEELAKNLPQRTFDFIAKQLAMFHKKKLGRRWSESDKTLALSLFHASRKAYRLLQKLFVLPSVSTLRKTMRDISVYPGFNDNILQALVQKVKALGEGAEVCSLVFDEMSIKEWVNYNKENDNIEGLEDFGCSRRSMYIANHAIVFMVRGLKVNWKQPVGYFLSSGPINSPMLKLLLCECLDKLVSNGIIVKCIIADQGSNNQKLFSKLLGVTEEEPFFTYHEKKYFVLCDPPHLIKNIRNNLKNQGFILYDVPVSWDHVVEFYHLDCKNSLRLAPKLTHKHINLPPFAKLKVKYATQVLSHTVASGISFIAKIRDDPRAESTAEFIEKFDMLFNCFNSGHFHSKKKMSHAFSDNSGHVEFLNDCLEWFKNLKPKITKTLPCMYGWKSSIRSLLLLWEDLRSNHGFSFLFTDRLNQDCLENLFSQVRSNSSHIDRPTAAQFRIFFARVMVNQLFLHPKGTNCQEDTDFFLITLNELSKNKNIVSQSDAIATPNVGIEVEASKNKVSLVIEDDENTDTDELLGKMKENVITYISGYIVHKIKDKICNSCQSAMVCTNNSTSEYLFLHEKQYNDCKRGLMFPSHDMIQAIGMLENEYCKHISNCCHASKIKVKLIPQLLGSLEPLQSSLLLSCKSCNIANFVTDLYFNLRLHHSLKECSWSTVNTGLGTKIKRNKKILKLNHE